MSKGMKRQSDGWLTVRSSEQVKDCSKLHQISSHNKETAEFCESLATSVLKHMPVSCPLVVDVIHQKFGKCTHAHTHTCTQAVSNPNDP